MRLVLKESTDEAMTLVARLSGTPEEKSRRERDRGSRKVWLSSFQPMIRTHLVIGGLSLLSVSADPIKIACIGDSITEGSGLSSPATQSYPARLQKLLGTNYIVKNFGVSGRTLLKKGDFPYWKEAAYTNSHTLSPDIVIIQLGTNDSKPQNWRYGTNFVSDYNDLIASYAGLTSAPRIYLCTPCPVYANGAYDIRPGIVATNIAPLVRQIAASHSLPVIELQTRMAAHAELFPDTAHPNSRGMAVMGAVMFSALRPPPQVSPIPALVAKLLGSGPSSGRLACCLGQLRRAKRFAAKIDKHLLGRRGYRDSRPERGSTNRTANQHHGNPEIFPLVAALTVACLLSRA
jgi:acyl-CoA thioesterase-1